MTLYITKYVCFNKIDQLNIIHAYGVVMKKYTVNDIAELAESSPASVSRVINNLPGVNKETRARIKSILEETGYQHSSKTSRHNHLNSHISSYSRVVALIVGDVRNPFYADITYHVQNMLVQHGYYVMLFNSEYCEEKELEFFGLADSIDFAGVIAVTAMESQEFLKAINNLSCPLVLINRTIEGYIGPSIVLDNFQAGYTATKHLIELGHSRIAFLSGPAYSSSSKQRMIGYKQALANYSIPFLSDDTYQGDLSMDSGYNCGKLLVQNHADMATAIICGNDLMAIGLMQACEENGIVVPKDLSVVGFDDISFSKLSKINLTTMRQPIVPMAQKTVEILIDKINNKNMHNHKQILESELIIRGTTSIPRFDN